MNFKELPSPTLSAADRERIMSRVLEASARRARVKQFALYTVATLLLAAAVVLLAPLLHVTPLYIVIAGCVLTLLAANDLILRRTNLRRDDSREPCAQ